MSTQVIEPLDWKRITATDNQLGQCTCLAGFLCTASGSGVLTITDAPAAGARTIVNALPVVAGNWYPIPARTIGQVTITLVSGTVDGTIFYKP
jgi:hypothetical protein